MPRLHTSLLVASPTTSSAARCVRPAGGLLLFIVPGLAVTAPACARPLRGAIQ
ncbi:hypothetical protein EMIHUDRAFT_367635 [Emiliania huxleyi CCMP1516]|uniref:Uncharacterized protein n=2 Tax=Emiliania huxleyi TaxID=2903 RepID=A0A0D3JMM1_EMIH1|nr:hypothetical protein EMIHUDRAFT_367635 [Emiliania huxleyi CCMP1516]EOD24756.1 hypothetical protein EMIHUDRAFT_367635 [Emiliania huxleyi CCMP1516]|eukprot:XP_005777185.1 hypothetical protein EMIHUDRAFT_367635 [Emiliania huxleyi CCMP1516]